MTLVSFGYLLLITAGIFLYYLCPQKFQWVILLGLSVWFYVAVATSPYTIIYLMMSTVVAFLVSNSLEKSKNPKFLVVIAIVLNIGIWVFLKIGGYLSESIVVSLGIGYYTLQVIGYVLDCHWGNIKPQKNILKLFLFTCFFPQMIAGPISRYERLVSMYEGHEFSYENLTHGAQRILWGFCKKLILAERVGIVINTIWSAPESYGGCYAWVALILYPIQMYADFSACMDIVIGTAECFGVKLTENFNNPFFSRTIQEFWRRWHISLGEWAKDFVLYPLLKSNFMVTTGKKLRNRFGKNTGKFITTAIGMLVLWFFIGVWHGGVKYVIGVSLWYWILLMLGEAFRNKFAGWKTKMKIQDESFSWHLLQAARTYLIYAIGAVFFRAQNVREAGKFLGSLLDAWLKKEHNFNIFFDGSLNTLGISDTDWIIILVMVALLIVVAVLREKYGFARIWVDKQILPFRWFVWIGLLLFVVIAGKYGAEYDSANFIYQIF